MDVEPLAADSTRPAPVVVPSAGPRNLVANRECRTARGAPHPIGDELGGVTRWVVILEIAFNGESYAGPVAGLALSQGFYPRTSMLADLSAPVA